MAWLYWTQATGKLGSSFGLCSLNLRPLITLLHVSRSKLYLWRIVNILVDLASSISISFLLAYAPFVIARVRQASGGESILCGAHVVDPINGNIATYVQIRKLSSYMFSYLLSGVVTDVMEKIPRSAGKFRFSVQ